MIWDIIVASAFVALLPAVNLFTFYERLIILLLTCLAFFSCTKRESYDFGLQKSRPPDHKSSFNSFGAAFIGLVVASM